MKKRMTVFLDCGDTLVDESTQIFQGDCEKNVVLQAGLIEGAREMVQLLHEEGYRLALVADGLTQSFKNILRQHDLEQFFEGFVTSEAVGAAKPSPRMFQEAMEQMGLTADDTDTIVMIGNNLKRDVLGARQMGMHSILLSYSPRYNMQPESAAETPDYVAAMPMDIPGLLEKLEGCLVG